MSGLGSDAVGYVARLLQKVQVSRDKLVLRNSIPAKSTGKCTYERREWWFTAESLHILQVSPLRDPEVQECLHKLQVWWMSGVSVRTLRDCCRRMSGVSVPTRCAIAAQFQVSSEWVLRPHQ